MVRMTNQRRVILKEIQKHIDHPTADELYMEVLKELPKVSLGTIYRNLEQMSSQGLILKIEGAGQKRFDPNPLPHPHFRCTVCGALEDIHEEVVMPSIDINSEWSRQREITGTIVEFYGLCPKCSGK